MKKTSLILLITAGLSPVLFSSCTSVGGTSGAGTTSAGPGQTNIANHQHYSSAAMGYENTWPFGPNT